MNKSLCALLLFPIFAPHLLNAMNACEILHSRLDLELFEAVDQGKHAKEVHRIRQIIDLYEAIGQCNVERAKELLKAGAEFDETAKKLYHPYTPLTLAVKGPISQECIEMCKLLLEQGVKIDEYSQDDKRTALMHAAVDGRRNICKFLLDQGADMLVRDKSNNTALLLVAKKYTNNRNKYSKKNELTRQLDPIWFDHMNDLKRTAQFLVAYQKRQKKSMLTWLACLKYHESSFVRELYRQRDKLFRAHLEQYLVKTLLEAKNDEGKCLYDYE